MFSTKQVKSRIPIMNHIVGSLNTGKKSSGLICSLSLQLICRVCQDHPHHTLFIIFALVNANKDETLCKKRLSKSAPRQSTPFDLVGLSLDNSVFHDGGMCDFFSYYCQHFFLSFNSHEVQCVSTTVTVKDHSLSFPLDLISISFLCRSVQMSPRRSSMW